MSNITAASILNSELVTESFRFWFNDHEHIRSPFPQSIRIDLKRIASDRFVDWLKQLHPNAKEEVNEGVIGEKLEEIIFEEGLKMADSEDQRIDILYPFLPRMGDEIRQDGGDSGFIVGRSLVREGDVSYLKVLVETHGSEERRETRFELPI